MENIASHLKLAELKQRNLCKAHEQLHSEASSFLLFSLQWKDLEQHFDSTRESIQMQYKELEERERWISLKERQLDNVEESIDECSKELELKKNELSKLNNLIEKYDVDIRLKEKELDSAQERLRNFSSDIRLKEREVNMVYSRLIDVEKEFEHREKVLDVVRKKINCCEREVELKEQKLNAIMQLIEERSLECELKEKDVESIRTLLQQHEEALATKEKQYDAIRMAIKEGTVELELKEKELESVQNMVATMCKEKRLESIEKSIKLRTQELDFKEEEFGLMQSKLQDLSDDLLFKESELESIKMCIKEHCKELDMQEKQLDITQKSIQECQNEVICLAEYISSMEKAIIECSKAWELKDNHLDSLQKPVDYNELASVEKQHNSISVTVNKCLEGLKAQKERFNLFIKSIEERSQKLGIEENDFERRTEELNKKDEKVSKCMKELELEKMDIAAQMKLLENGREELRLKEIQCVVQAEKLESKERDIDIMRALMEKCTEKEKLVDNSNINLKVKTEESYCRPANSSNTLNFHSGMTIDGKILLVLLCEHLKVHDLVRTELAIALQTSSSPAKLVLDAMRWFYPPHMLTEDIKFDVHNIKRGCILLSELLLKISPQITPPLKEEALKLAQQWKDKIAVAADNHLEVVAFLLLVANFGLVTDFNVDELHTLLNSISHYKQAVELGQALGIADKCPVVGSASQYLVKMKQPQSLPANKGSVSFLGNEQFSTNPNEKRLHLLLNEQLTGLELIPSAILSTLQKSSDPAKLVLEVIQGSIHPQLKKEQIDFEASSLRWCTLLLKQLMKISPHINPKVKEDARKLAVDWKSNIRTDGNNSLEIVSFLQLLVSYGLTTSFSGDEILKLFENIVLHEQASELCLMFGFTQQIHDLVQNLIGTKQFVKAVRFICGYKLESFRPVQILTEYLQDARNTTIKACKLKKTGQEEDEAVDREINAVKSVIKCIADCNLSSEISSQRLENHIASLKEMGTNKKTSDPENELQQLDRRNFGSYQQPHLTMVEIQQPHPINVEWQHSHSITDESQQPRPTKAGAQSQQPRPTKAGAQQPRPTKTGAQQPRKKKRKTKQYQNSRMKFSRTSPSTRPPGFTNSTPPNHDEKLKFRQYDSRFVGMHGLFGIHENGHGSTVHGSQYLHPPWPRF